MSSTIRCPYCQDQITVEMVRCPHCGQQLRRGKPRREWDEEEEDDEWEEDYRRPRRKREAVEAADFLIPMNVSPWAMASCYLGLLGFCLPIVGLIFAIPALIFGIIAVTRQRHQQTTYGSVTSNIRAIIGLVLSGLAIVGWGGLLIFILLNRP